MKKNLHLFLYVFPMVLLAGCATSPFAYRIQKPPAVLFEASREAPLMAPMSPVYQREVPGVEALALSPDGRYAASAGSQGVEIRDLSGKRTAVLHPMEGEVLSLLFSPDGRHLAVGGFRRVGVWDAATGERRWVREGHQDDVLAMAFSPDGKNLATGSRGTDRTLRVWDRLSGEEVRSLKIDTAYADQTRTLTWSPDGKTLAYAGLDGGIRLWEMETGRPIAMLREEGHLPVSLVYSPKGRFLTSGGSEGGILLWDSDAGKVVGRTRIGSDVRAMTYNKDGKLLTVLGADGVLRRVDTTSGEVRMVKSLGNPPIGAVLTPDGETLMTYGVERLALFSLQERTGLPPVIALLSPSESQGVVKDPVLRLSAKIVDDQGIDRVMVTVNGKPVGRQPFILRQAQDERLQAKDERLQAKDERRVEERMSEGGGMKTRDLILEGTQP
ncbi:MAG: WD40 repeat domain-containing protein, partial [Nitrospirae bacterium]|nr:WD40 repeat domain-containing protein [Nitrospirota bacterium]